MADFCDVTILGNIGQDPEIHATPSGKAIARCSIAVNKRFTDREGNATVKTEWIRLVAFDRAAEIARDYVKKGQNLVVKGTLQTTSWFDKEKQIKLYRTEVVVYSFYFTSPAARPAAVGGTSAAPVENDVTTPTDDSDSIEDFPF